MGFIILILISLLALYVDRYVSQSQRVRVSVRVRVRVRVRVTVTVTVTVMVRIRHSWSCGHALLVL